MPMSVLYDYQIFGWQKYGGISRYFYETANRIAGMEDTQVEIFSPFYVTSYFDAKSCLQPRGIKIPFIAHSGRLTAMINGALARFCVKPRKNIDILHETYYSPLDNRPRSAKRVVTIHDMIYEKFSDQFLTRDKTSQIKAQAVQRADRVICISENTKKDLIELLHVPEAKISVVYNGGSLVLSPMQADQSLRLPRPYLLYVGARGLYKNFAGLLRAYAASPQLKKQFSIVCFGGGHFNSDERTLMRSLGIDEERVAQMSGSDDVLAQLYTNASVFVMPSLYEGFGIPPLEAMACGCPVACSNTSSLPEVVGEAAELFDPLDSEAIRCAIENVVFSPARTNSLVTLGRLQAKRFSWEKCALETFEVYKKTLRE